MVARGTILKVVVGVVLLVGMGAGAYLYQVGKDFEKPQVESVENSFGDVSNETTTIHSRIVVQNPNEGSIPGGTEVRYTVSMNTVEVASGTESVKLQPGRNVINLTTELDNDKIPAWWVTHVNNNETTTITIEPKVSFVGLPVGAALPTQKQTVETSLLSAVEQDTQQTVTVSNQSLLEIQRQEASWGTATSEETPLVVKTTMKNVHDYPITLDGTDYHIEMNGVVVGDGRTTDSFTLQPGETGTFTARPAIATQKMQQWWVSHIRQNQQTRLSVSVYGVVEENGEQERVPVSVFQRELLFETDMLGPNETTYETVNATAETFEYEQPSLVETTSEWGTVTDASTQILTKATVNNPNEGDVGDIVTLRVDQRTTINGVTAAEGTGSIDGLQPGNNTFTIESEFDHSTVPAWWARHLNNGEESTMTVRTNATADIGVTKLDVAVDDREKTLSTDLLSGFNQSQDEPVEQGGETVMVIQETSASWGTATEQRAPIDTRVRIENQQPRTITIKDITYTVALNDVVLADNRTVDEQYTVAPYATNTITPTFVLDNSKMAAWWPTHVRNGEQSQMRTDVYATIVTNFGEKRVKLDSMSQNETVTTDLLAD